MTWEQFELTGAVEDYLQYKGIDWRTRDSVTAAAKGEGQSSEETGHGTVDNSDRYGAGRVSVR